MRITKTSTVTDVTAAGTTLHQVPTTRWTLDSDVTVAHLDVVACTAITAAKGDRRDTTNLLAFLTCMGFDFDVNEDDQHLEWMVGFDNAVWAVAPETIIDHCKAALTTYQAA